jgi:hypothetical protein
LYFVVFIVTTFLVYLVNRAARKLRCNFLCLLRFQVFATPARVVELELMEASLDPKRPQHGRRPPLDADYEKFSLIFCGRRSEMLEQKTLTFEHDQLGRFELLVLPIFTRHPDKIKYQAVFNRPPVQN